MAQVFSKMSDASRTGSLSLLKAYISESVKEYILSMHRIMSAAFDDLSSEGENAREVDKTRIDIYGGFNKDITELSRVVTSVKGASDVNTIAFVIGRYLERNRAMKKIVYDDFIRESISILGRDPYAALRVPKSAIRALG